MNLKTKKVNAVFSAFLVFNVATLPVTSNFLPVENWNNFVWTLFVP